MRKKMCMAALALCVAMSAAACGETKEDTKQEETRTEKTQDGKTEKEDAGENTEKEENPADETEEPFRLVSVDDVSKYVTLGEYKGMTLEKEAAVVTDDMIESKIQGDLEDNLITEKSRSVAVKEGDIANISYVGMKDGEAFDGGTADNYDLSIGSGTFIQGFEEGIVGMKTGETKDLNLTFPEEYPAADLAGQEVVFQVTLNAIKHVPELTDEWVAENTEYKTVEDYRESVMESLKEQQETSLANNLLDTAFTSVIAGSEVKEYPEEDIDRMKKEFQDEIELYAQQAGTDLEGFLESQGATQEDFEEQSTQYAEYRVKQALVIQGIMDAEGMTFEGKEADSAKVQMAQELGTANFDQIVAAYGDYAAYSSLGVRMVGQFVIDNGTIDDQAAVDEPEGFEDEDLEDGEAGEKEMDGSGQEKDSETEDGARTADKDGQEK